MPWMQSLVDPPGVQFKALVSIEQQRNKQETDHDKVTHIMMLFAREHSP